MSTHNEKYLKMRDHMRARGHRNKCVVIAIALLTGMDYDHVHATLAKRISRRIKDNDGYREHEYMPVLKELLQSRGLFLSVVPLQQVRSVAKTTRTLNGRGAARLGIQFGLVRVSGHVAAVVDHEVCDWTEKRTYRIVNLYRVVKGVVL